MNFKPKYRILFNVACSKHVFDATKICDDWLCPQNDGSIIYLVRL